MAETIYRVVCPDGQQAGANQFDEVWEAEEFAQRCDRMHDLASCGDDSHVIQQATWMLAEVDA